MTNIYTLPNPKHSTSNLITKPHIEVVVLFGPKNHGQHVVITLVVKWCGKTVDLTKRSELVMMIWCVMTRWMESFASNNDIKTWTPKILKSNEIHEIHPLTCGMMMMMVTTILGFQVRRSTWVECPNSSLPLKVVWVLWCEEHVDGLNLGCLFGLWLSNFCGAKSLEGGFMISLGELQSPENQGA